MHGDWDHIVVGAGSAGCAVAARLAEAGRRVLLVEAGGTDRRLFVQMPMGYGKLYMDPAVNWNFSAEPDPGLGGRRDHWPRGKLLGGSSSINAMVWVRGHPSDFDDWAAAGANGWGWSDVAPAFAAVEAVMRPAPAPGPLHPLTRAFLATGPAAGLPVNPDFNGAAMEGVGRYALTVRDGWRLSAARALLRPALARARGRLAVLTHAHTTRVLIADGRATGIAYRRAGADRSARAGSVILSAGAIGTPQLLMLSGIGPGAALAAAGVPVLLDAPQVGANLMDHQGISYSWRVGVPTLNDALRHWWGQAWAGADWLLRRRGILAASINAAGGFFRTRPDLNRPDMQLYFQAFSLLLPGPGDAPQPRPDPFSGMSMGLSNCRPRSRGRVALAGPDPFAPPRITANAFADPGDLADYVTGLAMLRRLAATAPLAGLIAAEVRPGPACVTEADLIADARARSGTVYHPCGTARMGPPGDGVLDPGLRVRGIAGLHVADAAAFPSIPGGNTNAPAIMLGWRAADLILAEARG